MERIYLWPEMPALSLLVFWGVSTVFLWAARDPMLDLLRGLGRGVEEALQRVGRWCHSAATELQKRSREVLLATTRSELLSRIEKEFHRIDLSYAKDLGLYARLHRKLDDLLQKLDSDYQGCIDSPPEVPGWDGAVKAVVKIPTNGNPGVEKVLDGIRQSIQDGEKRALREYREATSKRHRLLGAMVPYWKEIKGLMAQMTRSVGKALETSSKVEGYVTQYEQIMKNEEAASRVLSFSALKLFLISLVVLGVACGGAFINFQLIALPMSELVPSGAHIGGVPVATVSALVIVCMEVVVGVFALDMLGITDLFPKLATIPASRRRLILGVALAGLFFLASVESSLAILREKIVEADAALKMALAGSTETLVGDATRSRIPVVGQAVLGFVLPWILAMVAIPFEMLLDSARHVAASLGVLMLQGAGNLARLGGAALRYVTQALERLYDVYISIPLRIERMLRGEEADGRMERSTLGATPPPGAAGGSGFGR